MRRTLLALFASTVVLTATAAEANAQFRFGYRGGYYGGYGFRPAYYGGFYNQAYYHPGFYGYYGPRYYGYSAWAPYYYENSLANYAAANALNNYALLSNYNAIQASAYPTITYPNSAIVAAPSFSTTNQSFYPPAVPATPANLNEATLRIHTAADAQIWFNGTLTTQSGAERVFTTPVLEPGKDYAYEIRVRWSDGGRMLERLRSVNVAANKTIDVDLTPTALK